MPPKKKLTWQELKEIVNKIPEKLLSEDVAFWGEECGCRIEECFILKEDYVFTDEGACPKKEWINSLEEGEKWDKEENFIAYKKGTPILSAAWHP